MIMRFHEACAEHPARQAEPDRVIMDPELVAELEAMGYLGPPLR